jgi:predicted CXXCH cytochrome family protein
MLNKFTAFLSISLLPVAGLGCARLTPSSSMPLFAHPGGCRGCHGSERDAPPPGWRREEAPRDLVCATSGCHARLDRAAAFLHAPVAVGDCSACHAPHSSPYPGLLTLPANDLCSACHPQLLTCPASAGGRTACLSCHVPHGGGDHRLLRAAPAALAAPPALRSRALHRPPPASGLAGENR